MIFWFSYNSAPLDCLQYFTGASGRIKSYNWVDVFPMATRQLNNQKYNICFRTEIVSGLVIIFVNYNFTSYIDLYLCFFKKSIEIIESKSHLFVSLPNGKWRRCIFYYNSTGWSWWNGKFCYWNSYWWCSFIVCHLPLRFPFDCRWPRSQYRIWSRPFLWKQTEYVSW